MADLVKTPIDALKRNVVKLRDAGASDDEIDQHIIERGWDIDEFMKATNAPDIPATPQPQGMSLGGFGQNVLSSAKTNIIDMPIEAVKSLGSGVMNVGKGLMGDVASGQKIENFFKNLPEGIVQIVNQRYGSLDKAKETAYTDPIGVMSDIATLLSGVGGGLKLGTKIAGTGGKLARAAEVVGKVEKVVNPMTIPTKVVGTVAEKALAGALRPFAKGVQQEKLATFQKAGIDPLAGMVNKNSLPAIAEAVAARGLFGGKIADKLEEIGTKMNEYANKAIDMIGVDTDKVKMGEVLSNAHKKARDLYYKTKDELFEGLNIKDINVDISTPKFNEFITEQLDLAKKSGMKTPELNKLQELAKKFIGEGTEGLSEADAVSMIRQGIDPATINMAEKKFVPPTIGDAYATLKKFRERMKNPVGITIEHGEHAIINKAAAILDGELDKAIVGVKPELASALGKAEDYFSQTNAKFSKLFGSQVQEALARGEYDNVAKTMLNPKVSVMNIPELFDTLGTEAKDVLQAHIASEIFEKARGTKGIFSGRDIKAQINKYGITKLNEIFKDKPGIVQAMVDLQNMGEAVGTGTKMLHGSQTAFILRAIEYGKVLTAGNPLLAAKVILGDMAFAKFISSDIGQKWMKNGFQMPRVEAAVGKLKTPTAAKAMLYGTQYQKMQEDPLAKAMEQRQGK